MYYPNQRQISQESKRAPGLSSFPTPQTTQNVNPASKIALVSSINYDYLPMSLESPKTLWVDLIYAPSEDMVVDTPVVLHITPQRGITTSLNPTASQSVFQIIDIIGSRVVLAPYKGSVWLPTVHTPCDTPFGWGYNMNMTNVSPSMHPTKYGYGAPVSYLEYFPRYDAGSFY